MIAYFQGLVIGLAYVAPIGMQNLFVINSALAQPRRRALLTAAIVTLFDISLAFACYFGIGALVERFVWLQRVVLLAGAYSKLLPIRTGDFTAEVDEISYDQIPMLDSDSAARLGARKLGELADMVSQFEILDDWE